MTAILAIVGPFLELLAVVAPLGLVWLLSSAASRGRRAAKIAEVKDAQLSIALAPRDATAAGLAARVRSGPI